MSTYNRHNTSDIFNTENSAPDAAAVGKRHVANSQTSSSVFKVGAMPMPEPKAVGVLTNQSHNVLNLAMPNPRNTPEVKKSTSIFFKNQESQGERPFTASRKMVDPPVMSEPQHSQRARVEAPKGLATPTNRKGGIHYGNAETNNVDQVAHFSRKQIATPKASMPKHKSTKDQFHNQGNSSSLWAKNSMAGGAQPQRQEIVINVEQQRAQAPKHFHSSVRGLFSCSRTFSCFFFFQDYQKIIFLLFCSSKPARWSFKLHSRLIEFSHKI